jgi:hypothetical protein
MILFLVYLNLLFQIDLMHYLYSNRHDYVRHAVERQTARQPDQYRPPEGEMDTMTSYNKEYVGMQIFIQS